MAKENTAESPKTISPCQDFLAKEGCIFHPKSEVKIVPVPFDSLKRNYGEGCQVVSDCLLPILYRFVGMQRITDPFSEDHHARRAWRRSLPLDVRKYYEENNQLRTNNINSVLLALGHLGELSEFPNEFETTSCELLEDYRGNENIPEYAIRSDEEKIKFVDKLESTVRDVLGVLSK